MKSSIFLLSYKDLFRLSSIPFYRTEYFTCSKSIDVRIRQIFQRFVFSIFSSGSTEIISTNIDTCNNSGSDTRPIFTICSISQHNMVCIIELIDILLPPSIRQCIQCVFGILDFIPCIAGNSTRLRILCRKYRRNRKIDIHIPKVFIQQLHPIIISLDTRCHFRKIPFISLHRSMGHKIHFHILESCSVKQARRLFHHCLYSRMSRVNGISTVQFLWFSVSIKVDIPVFIFRSSIHRPFGVTRPVGKRSPVNTSNLAVRFTFCNE